MSEKESPNERLTRSSVGYRGEEGSAQWCGRADLDGLRRASGFLAGWLKTIKGYGQQDRERYLVQMAVTEALTNVIQYAYPDRPKGEIRIFLWQKEDLIEIEIQDWGIPFNATRLALPDLETTGEGGYGVFLMKKIMKSIHYERRDNKINCLHMTRDIPQERSDEKAEGSDPAGRSLQDTSLSGGQKYDMQDGMNEEVRIQLQGSIAAEDVKRSMERLSSISHITLVLIGDSGKPIFFAADKGSPCTLFESIREASGPSECCDKVSCPKSRNQVKKEILFRGQHVGTILGCVSDRDEIGRAREIVELLSDWITEKIENEYNVNSLSAEILTKYEEINLLYELSEEMGAVFNTQEVCDTVFNKVLNVIGAEKASILLYDPGVKKLRIVSSKGIPEEVVKETLIDENEGICGHVFKSGKPILVEHHDGLPTELKQHKGRYRTESFLSIPLMVSPLKVKEKVIGVINMADKPFKQSYTSGDMKLLSSISSQAALSIYNSMLIRDLKENERIQKEIEIAETVQKNLLPVKAPEIQGIDLAGRCLSAKRVGGDYFDFFHMPGEDRLGIMVADISGHSISAAIMMAITRGLLQSEALRNKDPATLLADVNRILFHDLKSSELFITMVYGSYCSKTRTLFFSNGGNNQPLLFRAGSEDPEFLESDGMALGFLEGAGFQQHRIPLFPGDLLVLYTDGLVKAENLYGNPFGMYRFLNLLGKNRNCSSQEIIEETFQAVKKYIGRDDPHHAQEDDITLVIMKVLEE